MNSTYVILGGGMVAGYAAKEMVERGLKAGELTIVSADSSVPYERPPLSKGFLAGKDSVESILISPESFYSEHGIKLLLNREVEAIDAGRRLLYLPSGDTLEYQKLLLATGSKVRTLTIPGHDLAGVTYLRSLDDAKKIRAQAASARKAVVIGSGFIAMEAASVLAQRKVETTMVVREDRVWKKLYTPEMSRFFENYFTEHGVRFVKQTEVTALTGDGSVASAQLSDASKLDCDMVIAGIGVTPVTGIIEAAGLQVSDGVVVNEYLEASAEGVWAAGDIASYNDLLFGKRRRVEHWDNAVSQGQHCARAMMGERAPFRHVPYFFSDVFDLSYEFWGDVSGAEEVVTRGDLSTDSFSVWWIRQGRLVAAFLLKRPDEERNIASAWIESRKPVASETLRATRIEAA